MVTQLKEVLKNLCSNNGWSYGVFWRVNPRNSMLLTLEDAYYDEKVGILIEKMSQQAHIMGEGIIGEVAITGKDRWMFSDTYRGKWNSVDNQVVFQDNSECYRQFSSGIETIAVISVAPLGVIQFGSCLWISERLEFVNQIKSLFQHLGRIDELLFSGNAPSVLNSEIYGFPPSAVDFENYNSNFGARVMHTETSNDLIRRTQTDKALSLPFPFTSGLYNAGMTNVHHKHQFQPAQVILSTPKLELPQPSLTHNFATKNPRMSSTWSNASSTFTSLEQQLLSGMGMQGSQNIFPSNPDSLVSCGTKFQNFQEDSIITSLHNLHGSSGPSSTVNSARSVEATRTAGYGSANATFPIEVQPTNSTVSLSTRNEMNRMSQWSSQQLEQGNEGLPALANDNLAQVVGVAAAPSGLVQAEIFDSVPVNYSASSMQSSISILDSRIASDEKEKSLNVPMQLPIDNNLFDNMEFDFSCGIEKECWDDILMPANNGSNPILSSGISGCISNLEVGSQVGSQADYFADFAVENLFNDIVGNPFSDTKPKSEEQLSTSVVTRTGGASQYRNQVQSTSISCLGESMDAFAPKLDPERMEKSDMNPTCKDNLVKSQLGAWVEDSYSINSGSAVTTNSKEPGQQGKVTSKRARPGESTRPRPKDRQLIQDRVKELREIVPNGAKCSIDSLLDRTIKHMLFLQGVTKYSDTLKQAEEPKIISEDGVVLKENTSVGGGATWALEVGGKSMFCPILVEDLSSKGQMLVEMLCEERGFFLEIADKIRGFGLTILKGVMEARNDKIWARFIVEAHRDVTRMDIFLSLANLLQQTETSGINSGKQQPTKVLDSIIPHLKEYQQNLQCYTQSV